MSSHCGRQEVTGLSSHGPRLPWSLCQTSTRSARHESASSLRAACHPCQAPTYVARCTPVSVDFVETSSAGVPSNTTRPPS